MANQLNSTGLSVGSLNGVIKEVVDPTGRGFLQLDSDTISKSGTYPSYDNSPRYSSTVTLPSINVGQTGLYCNQFLGSSTSPFTLKLKLPANGNYVYTKTSTTDRVDSKTVTLSLNLTTATRAAGGTEVVSQPSSDAFLVVSAAAAVLYYRYS